MKYLLCLSLLSYSLFGFSQVKSYYIDYKGNKASETDAVFKRTVEKEGKTWKVTDKYLNDTIQMTGTYANRGLTRKTGLFRYYHINGKSKLVVNYHDNLKQGVEYDYNVNGKPDQIKCFDKGELTGKLRRYDELGNLEREINAEQIKTYYAFPEYEGGLSALRSYVSGIKYPQEDAQTGYIANPLVSFTIDTCGSVRNIDMIVLGTEAMNKEIKFLLEKMPQWHPGKHNGKKVEATYFIPFNFQMQSNGMRVKTKPKEMAQGFYASAVNDYKNNEFKSAITKLKEAARNDHMKAKNYLMLGLCYYKSNNNDFAIEYFKIAHSLDNEILPAEIKEQITSL
jgi:antitoxin component YwqK of YwqJK toxin-antitoxin module